MIRNAETPMSERSVRTALISTDRGFREVVKDVFLSHEGWTAPALELTALCTAWLTAQPATRRPRRA